MECALALRELDQDRVVLVAPEPEFVARPMLVAEALGAGTARRLPLSEFGFEVEHATVIEVDPQQRRVLLRGGGTLPYDTLVLAPGARTLPAFEDAIHLPDDDASTRRSPAWTSSPRRSAGWLLPLYEAALLTAHRHPHMRVTLVTPEERPLQAFGDPAVADALAQPGVAFAHERTDADRLVSLPLVRGPQIPGVPTTGLYDFIPVDAYQRVVGLDRRVRDRRRHGLPGQAGRTRVRAGRGRGRPHRRRSHRAVPARATRDAAHRHRRDLLLGGGQGPQKIPGRRVAHFLSAARAAESPGTPWTAPPGNVAALPR